MIRFGKKEESDHCRVMVGKKQYWNSKHQIQDPLILHVCELNIYIEDQWIWDRLKFWISRSALAILSSNIWSKLKSQTIKILCCVGRSLINKIKSSMKAPRGPGIQYTITNNKVYFSISSTTGSTYKTLRTSISYSKQSRG